MIRSVKKKEDSNFLLHAIFTLFSVVCLFPFTLVISASFSSEMDLATYGFRILPHKVDLTAYKYIFENPAVIANSYLVTVITTIAGTVLSVLMMSMTAYPIARSNFKYRRVVSFYIFFTMLFSGGLVPSYILITQYLKMRNTLWVLIVPGLISGYHIIMLKAFFLKTPASLFESAKIDGASEYKIFFRIVVPLSTPAIAAIAFFGVMARWNDWYTALLYINNDSLLPLQYLLYRIMSNVQFIIDALNRGISQGGISIQDIPGENLRMAMLMVACGPVLIVFPFFQKYFVQGLTVGAIKG